MDKVDVKRFLRLLVFVLAGVGIWGLINRLCKNLEPLVPSCIGHLQGSGMKSGGVGARQHRGVLVNKGRRNCGPGKHVVDNYTAIYANPQFDILVMTAKVVLGVGISHLQLGRLC